MEFSSLTTNKPTFATEESKIKRDFSIEIIKLISTIGPDKFETINELIKKSNGKSPTHGDNDPANPGLWQIDESTDQLKFLNGTATGYAERSSNLISY